MRRVQMLVGAVCMALIAGCGSERAGAPAGEDGAAGLTIEELEAEVAASDGDVVGSIHHWFGGVSVEAGMTFAEDRHVVGMTLELGGVTDDDVSFYPDSYDTGTGEENPGEFDVAAGESLFASGLVVASCAGEPDNSLPVLEVSFTRGGGEVEVERLEVRTLKYGTREPQWAQVADVVRAYCEAGVTAHGPGGGTSPDGDARVRYMVHNPGPDDVTVTSRAGSHKDLRWQAAGPVTVPAGETVLFRAEGKGERRRCHPGPLHLELMEAVGPNGSQTLTTDDPNGAIC